MLFQIIRIAAFGHASGCKDIGLGPALQALLEVSFPDPDEGTEFRNRKEQVCREQQSVHRLQHEQVPETQWKLTIWQSRL
jgi:hypothetical protein